MKKSGSKILGIAAVIAVIVYWGNVFFGGKYSDSSKKSSSQSTYVNPGDILVCTTSDGEQTIIVELGIWGTSMALGGFKTVNLKTTNLMFSGHGYSDFSQIGGSSSERFDLRVNRKNGVVTLDQGDFKISGKCEKWKF